jgi:hypothetical protein
LLHERWGSIIGAEADCLTGQLTLLAEAEGPIGAARPGRTAADHEKPRSSLGGVDWSSCW